ncbi:MAG: hypothetical protein KF855_03830 [Acidobacteria bacterium]|nr:hypothetical protein [Acidobacteriota bacterium]
MAYADLNQLKADYLPDTNSAPELTALGRILDNVSAFVDTYCRRRPGYFNPSPADPTTRRVRGEGQHYLRLPKHIPGSISSIALNGQTLDPASYYESDKNGWIYAEDTDSGFSSDLQFYEDRIYLVTARWGYAATPLDIGEAVRQTVVRIWEAQRGVLGDVTPDGFVIERVMPPFAKEVLDNYKRREFEI